MKTREQIAEMKKEIAEAETAERAERIDKLVVEFRDFCKDSILDEMGAELEDHAFLECALETFLGMKAED